MMRFLARIRIRVNCGELSGAFGDIGTALPLLTGMILASGMHPASVLTVFGLAQIGSALFYGIPMPVQPLKAVAALVSVLLLNNRRCPPALPVLGVILVTEGVMLMRFIRDTVPDRFALATALLTAACAILLPSGFLVGMVAGTGMAYAPQTWRSLKRTFITPIVPEESDA